MIKNHTYFKFSLKFSKGRSETCSKNQYVQSTHKMGLMGSKCYVILPSGLYSISSVSFSVQRAFYSHAWVCCDGTKATFNLNIRGFAIDQKNNRSFEL